MIEVYSAYTVHFLVQNIWSDLDQTIILFFCDSMDINLHHVRSMTIRSSLQIYALEERIQNYKEVT
jgi:hypothetical protein